MEVLFIPDHTHESCEILLAARNCERPEVTAAEIIKLVQESALLVEMDFEEPTIQ